MNVYTQCYQIIDTMLVASLQPSVIHLYEAYVVRISLVIRNEGLLALTNEEHQSGAMGNIGITDIACLVRIIIASKFYSNC